MITFLQLQYQLGRITQAQLEVLVNTGRITAGDRQIILKGEN